jgi:putative endonuclease
VPIPSPRSRASLERAAKRWYVYLILCRGNAIYTGIALDVAARYAQHVAGSGARYTRANPPRRLLARFACPNQSTAGRLEAAIKRLSAAGKRKLIGTTGAAARKLLLRVPSAACSNTLIRRIEDMPAKEPGFAERLKTADKAKQAKLEKIRATTQASDPQLAERQAAQVKTAEARKTRTAERKDANRVVAKQVEAKRAAEKAGKAHAAAEQKARKEAERVAKAQADAALKQEQKAARDAKYAARKARQK